MNIEELRKAIEKLKKEGYDFDVFNHKININGNPQNPSRDLIEILEKNGYWIDLKEKTIKSVDVVEKAKQIECLTNDSIENKVAVLTYLKGKYASPVQAAEHGYPLQAIKHASDVIKQEKQRLKNEPRTYVCTDIHGMYGSYCDAIKKVKDKDMLFILGDVIDRGKYGIKILQDIMKRKNVVLFMGNHEFMMKNCLDVVRKHNLKWDDVEKVFAYCDYSKNKKIFKFQLETCQKLGKDISEELEKIKKCEVGINSSKDDRLSDKDYIVFDEWKSNHCIETLRAYMQLGKDAQEQIYSFLSNMPIMGTQTIKGQKYVFVHSRPVAKKQEDAVKYVGYLFRLNDVNKETAYHMVWTRDEEDLHDSYKGWTQSGFKVICGHEPVNKIEIPNKNGVIRLDLGCGHRYKTSQLALYCIETGGIDYIPEKEKNDPDIGGR